MILPKLIIPLELDKIIETYEFLKFQLTEPVKPILLKKQNTLPTFNTGRIGYPIIILIALGFLININTNRHEDFVTKRNFCIFFIIIVAIILIYNLISFNQHTKKDDEIFYENRKIDEINNKNNLKYHDEYKLYNVNKKAREAFFNDAEKTENYISELNDKIEEFLSENISKSETYSLNENKSINEHFHNTFFKPILEKNFPNVIKTNFKFSIDNDFIKGDYIYLDKNLNINLIIMILEPGIKLSLKNSNNFILVFTEKQICNMPTKCCNLIQETIFDISNKTFRFLNDETNFHDFTEELKEEIELTNIMKDTELLNYRKSYMPEYLSKKFNFYTTAKRELELKAISERALKAIENMDDLPF